METSSSPSQTGGKHAEVKTPRGIILKQSQVVDGLGAWSSLPIVEGGLFGPFARDVENEKDAKAYTWEVYDACTNELLQVVNGTDAVSASWMRYIRNARFFEEQNMISTQVGAQTFYKAIKDIGPNEELLTYLGHAERRNQQMEAEETLCEKISKKRVRPKKCEKNGEATFDDDDEKQEAITIKLKKVKKENVSSSPSYKNPNESMSPPPKREKAELPIGNFDGCMDELGGKEQETTLPNTRQLNKQCKDNNTEEEDEEFYYFFETRQCNVIENKGTKLYKCDVCKGVYRYAFSLKRHFLRNHINCKYLSEADISNCMINVVQQDMVAKRQPTGRRAKLNSSSPANNRASSKPQFVSNSVSRSELYRCSLCSELFDYIEDLVEHTHHHMTSPPSVASMVPVKTQLVCSTCNMKFTYKQNFIRHQAVHSGERPFQCEFCFRTFPTQISRKQHIRIHIFNTKNKTVTNNKNSSTTTTSSSSSSSSKIVSVPVVKQTVKVEPEADVPSEEDLKCQICGKTFSCSSFLNKHIVCMHNGAMKRKANQNRRANHQKESYSSNVKTESVEEEGAKSTDSQALILKALKTAKKKNQFKYTCTVCQRKFRLYIQMCKHKRAAHGKILMAQKKAGFYDLEQTGFEDELLPGDLEAPFLESKDVAENVARNLTSFIDGNIDSLLDFTKYVKIKGYTSVHEHDPNYIKQTDVAWSQYNFPVSFRMPVEEMKIPVVSCTSGNLPCLPSLTTTTSLPFDLNKEASSKCKQSTTNISAVTASVNGKQTCINVEPHDSEKISSEKSSLLSSNSDLLGGASAGTSISNSSLQTQNSLTTTCKNICDITLVNQSSMIGNLPVVTNANLPVVSQIPNSTKNSALAVPTFLLPSTVANLTNVPAATNLGPSVDSSNSLKKDKLPIENSSSSQSCPGVPISCSSSNLGESSSSGSKPGRSVRFQSAFLVHEFCSDGSTGPNISSAIIKTEPAKEILPESNTKHYLSLSDDKLKSNSTIALAHPKSCDSNLSSQSLEDMTQDAKNISLSPSNSPADSAKPSEKSLKSVQKDVLFSGPHMMTAHIHERGHMVLEFGDDKKISTKVKNSSNPQGEESSKTFSLKSHGLVKKSKKNHNLLDFSIQHIVKMRVQEFKDYISQTNPTIKLEDNSSENKDSLINNELYLASYPSCDIASRLGNCVEKTNKDFNKISAFLKSGLLPCEKLKDLKKSVPSFSFGGQEDFFIDYSQVAFGKHGIINFVCSVCRKHFLNLDLCLRHQQHRHPSIECNFLEVELGNSIVSLHYPLPDRDGLLSQSTVDLSACKNLQVYTCSKCRSSFPTVTRLHSHIVRCATNPPGMAGITSNVIGKHKYKKRLKKRLRDVLNGSNTFKFRLKDFAGYDPTLFQENQVQRRRFRGCRNRKIVTVHETMMKTRKRRNYDLSYDPKNHVRRRESVEVVEKQQCRGCNVKFKSISLLERHAPNCIRKDKLQNLKVLEGIHTSSVRTVRPLHRCHYCNKQFTYLKSLCNHYLNCNLRKQQERTGSLQHEDLMKEKNMTNLEREKSLEELSPFLSKESSDNEQHLNIVHKGGWPKGLKRKFRRKNHSWTCIKRKRLKDSEDINNDDQENTRQVYDSNGEFKTEVKIESDVKVAEKAKACLEELLISRTSEKGSKKPIELNNSSCGSVQTGSSINSELKQSKPSFAYKLTSTADKQWKNISESELYKQLTKNISTLSSDVNGDTVISDTPCQNQASMSELQSIDKNNIGILKQSVNEPETSTNISGKRNDVKENKQHLVIDVMSEDYNSFSKGLVSKVSTAAKAWQELSSTLVKPEDKATEYCQETLAVSSSSSSSSSLQKDIDVSVSIKASAKKQDSFESDLGVTDSPELHSSILASLEKCSKCNNNLILEQCSHCKKCDENISEPVNQPNMLPGNQSVVLPLNSGPVSENQEARSASQEENTLIATCSVNGSILSNQSSSSLSLSSLPENLCQNKNLLIHDKNLTVRTSPLSPLDKSKCHLEVYDEDCQSSLLATEEMDMPRQFETVIDIEPCEMVVESKEPVMMLSNKHIEKQDPEVSKTDVVVEDDVIKDTCKVFEVVQAKPNVIMTQASDTCQASVSSVELVSQVAEETVTKFIQNAEHLTQLPTQVILSNNQIKQLPSQVTLSNAQLPQVPTQMALSHAQLLQLPAQVTLSNAQLLQLPAQMALPSTQMNLSNVQLAQLPTQVALSNTQLTQIPTRVTLANAHLAALPTHVALSNPQLSTHLTLSNTHLAQLPTQVTLSNTQLTQLPTQVTLSNAHLTQIPTQVILSNAHLTQLSTEMPVPSTPHLTQSQVQVISSNAELSKAGKLIWPHANLTQANIKLSQPQVDMTLSNPNLTCPQADVTPSNAVLTQVNRDLPLLQTEMNLPHVELTQAKVKLIPPKVEMNSAKPEIAQSNALFIHPQAPVTQANAKLAWPLTQMTQANAQLTQSNVKLNQFQGDTKQKNVVVNQPQVKMVPPSAESCQTNIDLSEVKVTNVNSTKLQRDVTLLNDSLTQTNTKLTMSQPERDVPFAEINRQQMKLTLPSIDSALLTDKIIASPKNVTPLNKPCQAILPTTCVESSKTSLSSSFTKVDTNMLNNQPVELVNVQCGFPPNVCQLGCSVVAVPAGDQSSSTNTDALFSTINKTTVMTDELTQLKKLKENLDNMEVEVGKSSYSLDVANISKISEPLQHFDKLKLCQTTVPDRGVTVNSPSVPENSSSENEFTALTSLNFESELELEVLPEAIMEGDILYEDFPPSASCIAITNSTTSLETPPDCRKSLSVAAMPLLNSKSLKLMPPALPFSSPVPIKDLINYDSSLGERNNYVLCIVPEIPLNKMSSASMQNSSKCQPLIGCDDGNQSETTNCQGPNPKYDNVATEAAVAESDTPSTDITHIPQTSNANNINIQQ